MTLILPLIDGHDRKDFDCGNAELNDWLNRIARQHKQKGVSSTFVAVSDVSSTAILGFYAISPAELVNADLPAQYRASCSCRFAVVPTTEPLHPGQHDRIQHSVILADAVNVGI